jgi:hypothetical protein
MSNYQFKTRSASIILISAGYGWAGGHYIPANSPLIAYSFQFIVISLLLVLGIKFLGLSDSERQKSNWSIKGLSIFSSLALLMNILNIINGVFNSGEDLYGSHNSFADLVPISLIIIGSMLWLSTLLVSKKAGKSPVKVH